MMMPLMKKMGDTMRAAATFAHTRRRRIRPREPDEKDIRYYQRRRHHSYAFAAPRPATISREASNGHASALFSPIEIIR